MCDFLWFVLQGGCSAHPLRALLRCPGAAPLLDSSMPFHLPDSHCCNGLKKLIPATTRYDDCGRSRWSHLGTRASGGRPSLCPWRAAGFDAASSECTTVVRARFSMHSISINPTGRSETQRTQREPRGPLLSQRSAQASRVAWRCASSTGLQRRRSLWVSIVHHTGICCPFYRQAGPQRHGLAGRLGQRRLPLRHGPGTGIAGRGADPGGERGWQVRRRLAAQGARSRRC